MRYKIKSNDNSHHLPVHLLSKSGTATAHNFTLADQLGTELGAIKSEVNIKVDSVESSLWRIHALEIFLQILP